MFPRTYFFTFTVGGKKAILVLNKSIAQGSEDHEHRKTFQSAKLKRTENLFFFYLPFVPCFQTESHLALLPVTKAINLLFIFLF